MPLRSSLARSLQYAMANMADIKTPLCALQPTPAIPHTASRSGAGTRGGERGLEAGRRHGARVPPTPGARRPRCSRPPPFAGPEADGRDGADWALGRREPAPRSSSPSRARAHFLTLAPSQRRFLTGEGAGKLSPPARRLCERQRRENCGVVLLPRGRRARHLSPPPAAGARGGGDAGGPKPPSVGLRRGAQEAQRTDGKFSG